MTPIDSPYDWLLIRATKDCSPKAERLRRIWSARCLFEVKATDPSADRWIAQALYAILGKTQDGVGDMFTILATADPAEGWKSGIPEDAPYWTRIMLSLASRIRYLKASEFLNYRSPARFR
jgi:hypothetical protein